MYRESGWADGYYVDNQVKFQCGSCGKHFIVGEKLLSLAERKVPFCPYCGRQDAEWVSFSEDDMLEDLSSDMGCLIISIDLEELAEYGSVIDKSVIEEKQPDK